ncbi:hypothetical protein D3C87_171900 [compost metagenome]
MKTKYLIIAFAITALLQISAPLKMIYDSESTERNGVEYKFRTAPIDPSDPFRGKYITLSFDLDITSVQTKDTTWLRNEPIFVSLAKDSLGFAKIGDVSREKPKDNTDYITTTVGYYYGQDLHINIPFDRFYMEEGKAYDAEVAYRDFNRDSINTKPTYALVAVKDGNAVLKNVIIDDMPIKDYVLKERDKK